MEYQVGALIKDDKNIKQLRLAILYEDIPDIDRALALCQYASRNRIDPDTIVCIIPSHNNDPVILENGRILDRIYRGDYNEQ